jgi:Nuclease-related domain/UvrD-like helicase C-terminal domain
MARMIPTAPSLLAATSEHHVFEALSRLPDDWTVFHSVGWQSERHGRPGDGEADFLLLHRNGLLVLEVKGGRIHIVEGQWMSNANMIRNPYEQALDSRKALQRYVLDHVPEIGTLHTGHAACFPDVRIGASQLGPDAPPEITIDRDGLSDVETTMGKIAAHWELRSGLDVQSLKRIRNVLAPTVTVRPLAREVTEDIGERLLQLTRMQIAILSAMRRQRRLTVYGGAGTGKTVLAVERARVLADDDFTVLLACFNQPLGRHLAHQFEGDDRVRAGSFASICRELAIAAGVPIPERPTQQWWDAELPGVAPSYAEATGYDATAVVVDEGQDFAPAWWETLELLTRNPEEDPFYVFVDAAQQLYRKGWMPPFEEPRADLDINCRNTIEIAEHVGAVFGTPLPTLGTHGPKAEFIKVKSVSAASEQLEGLLDRFLNEGKLKADQLVILSSSRPTVDALRGSTLAGYGLVAPEEDGVVVETVQRFKGLEADVVILMLPEVDSEQDRVFAYVGMSRARVHLVVVGTAPVRAALAWDA